MSAVTDRVQQQAHDGVVALLSWAFEEIGEIADTHRQGYGEDHRAQPWLDSMASDDAPMWAAGQDKFTGNQAMVWLTSDNHEVKCELVWSVTPLHDEDPS